ncbi:hypothetical protein FSP39_008912 [Pinctada imbricata]|uniref:GRIP1-associated protein 1 n=1 Tax=Pinctada imbricata TaxID=66713 RepID=A0AA88YCF8_PINIB|nr:hypothetical protein FSP39_008912 [Pinctada imbricata]
MSSSLSEEEFHRMQLQLLELRTANYELDGKTKKQERDILTLNEKLESTEKDLAKAHKAIQKSKKAKEVELLIQENDQLQRKLHSQEEEFRLQNQTLMQELSSVISTNEKYEKELAELHDGNSSNSSQKGQGHSELEDECRRLQAQNNVLQKNLSVCQEKYEKQLSALTEQLRKQATQENKDGDHESNSGSPDMATAEAASEAPSEALSEAPSLAVAEGDNNNVQELKLKLEMELEEKNILKEQLQSLENSLKEKISSLQDEVEKSSEKLKRKQESYMQLHKEKEKLFTDSNAKAEELQSARDRDQKYYTEQINKLQQEVQRLKQVLQDKESEMSRKVQEMEATMSTLKQQADAASIVENQQMKDQLVKYQQQTGQLQQQLLGLTQQRDDLGAQLEEVKKANSDTLEQLHALQVEREERIREWQEINKVAEKRKTMLDELANTYQRDNANYQEKLRQMEEEHEEEMKSLSLQIESEQKRGVELDKIRQQCEELRTQKASLEEAKGWLERRLKEVEESLENLRIDSDETSVRLKQENEQFIASLKIEHEQEISKHQQEFEDKLKTCSATEESLKEDIEKSHSEIKKLKQELKDGVEEKKIHEKKGKTMIKDLKRQVHAERKRAEKLQDKLQEVLTENHHNKSIEDLFAVHDGNDSLDRSSISSWNTGASLVRDSSILSSPHSPDKSDKSISPVDNGIEEEHTELISRLAGLQQDKWNLEEKVQHLETSNAAMAEDLIQKSKIIEHYVMERRVDTKSHTVQDDKITLKKVLDLVNKHDEQSAKDMNRKLQNMLEETLTKNMHLQKDLEVMSQEVVRLSKLQPLTQSAASDIQNDCGASQGDRGASGT